MTDEKLKMRISWFKLVISFLSAVGISFLTLEIIKIFIPDLHLLAGAIIGFTTSTFMARIGLIILQPFHYPNKEDK